VTQYLQDFEGRSATSTVDEPEWLEAIRRAGITRFADVGFPTSRDEEWRFTPVGPIARGVWHPASGSGSVDREQLLPFLFGHPEWSTLVFLNGAYDEQLS
jgi:Fe-S cluster assembly protein SufD